MHDFTGPRPEQAEDEAAFGPEAEGEDLEALSQALEADLRDRRWVAALTRFLDSRAAAGRADDDLGPRVRYALDDATIAACERLSRILRADLPPLTPGADD